MFFYGKYNNIFTKLFCFFLIQFYEFKIEICFFSYFYDLSNRFKSPAKQTIDLTLINDKKIIQFSGNFIN